MKFFDNVYLLQLKINYKRKEEGEEDGGEKKCRIIKRLPYGFWQIDMKEK
jgi:hypothetical protein